MIVPYRLPVPPSLLHRPVVDADRRERGSGNDRCRPDQPEQRIAACRHAELADQTAPRLATERDAHPRLRTGEPPRAPRPRRDERRQTLGEGPAPACLIGASVATQAGIEAHPPTAER
jgi:hypothetical protein